MSSATWYGRTPEEWGRLVDAGTDFLIGSARLNEVTTYSEMNVSLTDRTGIRAFDFDRADERAAMGHLLGLITNAHLSTSGFMLSALARDLGEDDAGPGFFLLAEQFGLLSPGASADERMEFWIGQVTGLHAYYD